MKRSASFVLAFALLTALSSAAGAQEKEGKDAIRIVSVTSAAPIQPGRECEITVEVEYTLDAVEEGEINVGFNTDNPKHFRMIDSRIVKRGSGTVSLAVKVVPVDWQERSRFKVLVNLSEFPHRSSWQPLAGEEQVVELER